MDFNQDPNAAGISLAGTLPPITPERELSTPEDALAMFKDKLRKTVTLATTKTRPTVSDAISRYATAGTPLTNPDAINQALNTGTVGAREVQTDTLSGIVDLLKSQEEAIQQQHARDTAFAGQFMQILGSQPEFMGAATAEDFEAIKNGQVPTELMQKIAAIAPGINDWKTWVQKIQLATQISEATGDSSYINSILSGQNNVQASGGMMMGGDEVAGRTVGELSSEELDGVLGAMFRREAGHDVNISEASEPQGSGDLSMQSVPRHDYNDKSLVPADRNFNPGNIKLNGAAQRAFNKGDTLGAIALVQAQFPGVQVHGVAPNGATDGGNFIQFESAVDGFKAAKSLLMSNVYADMPLDAAMRKWSGGGYGADILTGGKPIQMAAGQGSGLSASVPQVDIFRKLSEKTPAMEKLAVEAPDLLYGAVVAGKMGIPEALNLNEELKTLRNAIVLDSDTVQQIVQTAIEQGPKVVSDYLQQLTGVSEDEIAAVMLSRNIEKSAAMELAIKDRPRFKMEVANADIAPTLKKEGAPKSIIDAVDSGILAPAEGVRVWNQVKEIKGSEANLVKALSDFVAAPTEEEKQDVIELISLAYPKHRKLITEVLEYGISSSTDPHDKRSDLNVALDVLIEDIYKSKVTYTISAGLPGVPGMGSRSGGVNIGTRYFSVPSNEEIEKGGQAGGHQFALKTKGYAIGALKGAYDAVLPLIDPLAKKTAEFFVKGPNSPSPIKDALTKKK